MPTPEATSPPAERGGFQFDVFISYATEPDYAIAHSLQRFLTTFHQRSMATGPEDGMIATLTQGGRRLSVWDLDPDRAALRAQRMSKAISRYALPAVRPTSQ